MLPIKLFSLLLLLDCWTIKMVKRRIMEQLNSWGNAPSIKVMINPPLSGPGCVNEVAVFRFHQLILWQIDSATHVTPLRYLSLLFLLVEKSDTPYTSNFWVQNCPNQINQMSLLNLYSKKC